MTNEEEQTTFVVVAGTLAVVAVPAVLYVKTLFSERRKRKQIEAKKVEMLACIARSKQRLIDMLDEPTTTLEDFLEAAREEDAFLGLVWNQPL